MSETQFHTWLAQNIDRLAQEEKVTVIESYEKGHTDREDNLYKLTTFVSKIYGNQNEHGDYK